MTIFKKWLNNLVYSCAKFTTSSLLLSLSPEWDDYIRRVDRFFKYYELNNIAEYGTFCNIANSHSSFGRDTRATDLLKLLLSLEQYELRVPKFFDRVFISHSSKDIDVVKPFVELLASIGLSKDKLFCSSVDGYGIPLGENIYDYLKREFTDKNTLVIMMMSDNYYDSKPSLNEMGAAWVMSKEYISILIKDFSFDKIEGAADKQKIGFKIEDSFRLDEFKDRLVKELRLTPNVYWEARKKTFLTKIADLKNEEK